MRPIRGLSLPHLACLKARPESSAIGGEAISPQRAGGDETDSAGSTRYFGSAGRRALWFRPRTGLPSPGLPQGSPPKLTPLVAQPLVSKEREAPRTDSAAWTEVPGFGMAPRLLYPQAGTHQLSESRRGRGCSKPCPAAFACGAAATGVGRVDPGTGRRGWCCGFVRTGVSARNRAALP